MPDTNAGQGRPTTFTGLDPEFIAAWKRDADRRDERVQGIKAADQDAKVALMGSEFGRPSTASACAHIRWSVFDTDPWGIARCTDCGQRFPLANALQNMLKDIKIYQDRLEACLGMVVARASSVPKGAPLVVQAGRAIEEPPEEDEAE